MRFRCKLLIFLSSLLLSSTPTAFANIYRINLDNYNIIEANSTTGISGTLTGFIVINESLVGANDPDYNRSSQSGPIPIPAWITGASLTWTNDDATDENNYSITRTLYDPVFPFTQMNWQLTELAAANGFDPSSEFTSQMETFGLSNGIEFTGNPSGGLTANSKMVQQFHQSEALLTVPVSDPVAAPAPLPILGLLPLAWYFRKFKKKTI